MKWSEDKKQIDVCVALVGGNEVSIILAKRFVSFINFISAFIILLLSTSVRLR